MKNEKLEGLKQIWRIVIVNLQFKKSLSVLFFIITFGSYFAACEMEPANIPVDSMRLNPGTLTLTLGVNETAAIVAVILPENATNKTVTWSSSNRNIVTVESGVVTAVATGTVTITAAHVEGTSTNNRTFYAYCSITVNPAPVSVTDVILDQTILNMNIGEKMTLAAMVQPENAANKAVTWSSSNTNFAIVENGLITAVAAGTATITVTTVDGNKTASCLVTVNPTPPVVLVTGVTLEQTELNLTVGDDATLVATVLPEDATNKNITWTTSNINIARVSDGLITAVAAGTATITVTTVDGNKTASCLVTVNPVPVPVTGVTINETSLNFVVNGYTTLTATVQPNNATNKAVTWSSDNTNVATVENGLITAIAEGTATISVTTEDGSKTADCNVTVLSSPNCDKGVGPNLWRIAFGNNTFIGLDGNYGTRMHRSSDSGMTWTNIVDNTFGTVIWGITYGDNVFVAVGNDGKMARSIDNGITWTAVADSTFGTSIIYQIAYGNNVFIAVGEDGKMARSTDNGLTWTAVTDSLFGTASLVDIIYGNNTFIAVIEVAGGIRGRGTMIRSTDNGITWTAVTDSPNLRERGGITFGNNVFVALYGGYNIVRSTDNGVTWMPVTTFSTDISGIAYGGNIFIAASGNRKMSFSTDNGVTWNSFIAPWNIGGPPIAYGNNIFITGGLVRLSFD